MSETVLFLYLHIDMSKLLVTHNDLDGISAVVVARIYGFDGDIYIAPNPQQIPLQVLSDYDEIIVTDLSPSEEIIQKIEKMHKPISIYDHHAYAKHIIPYGGVLDTERCGSKIYFENVYESKEQAPYNIMTMEHYFELVDAWDRFVMESPLFNEAIELQDFFNGMTKEDKPLLGMFECTRFGTFVERILNILKEEMIDNKLQYNEHDKTLIAEEQRIFRSDYNEALKTLSKRTDAKGRPFGICLCDGNASLILNQIVVNEGLDYIISFRDVPTKNDPRSFLRVSARARSDIDLNTLEFLKGHPKAAGGTMPTGLVKALLNGRMQYINYRK